MIINNVLLLLHNVQAQDLKTALLLILFLHNGASFECTPERCIQIYLLSFTWVVEAAYGPKDHFGSTPTFKNNTKWIFMESGVSRFQDISYSNYFPFRGQKRAHLVHLHLNVLRGLSRIIENV